MDIKTVKSSDIIRFLGIPYTTFATRLKMGLLGQKHQFAGRGRDRRFDFDDVCTARIIEEVISLTNDLKIAQEAAKFFRSRHETLKPRDNLDNTKNSILTPDNPHNMTLTIIKSDLVIRRPNSEIIGVLKRGDIYPAWSVYGSEGYRSEPQASDAVLIVDVGEIMKTVRSTFPGLDENTVE